jgi:steroid 5-alpha reductase family enzyme
MRRPAGAAILGGRGSEPTPVMEVLLTSAAGVAVVMVVTWTISVWRRDASLVDIVWGLGFVVVATASALVGGGADSRRLLLLALVGVWGLRLSAYLAWRNLGHGEDRRYQRMRRHHGEWFWLRSLVTVFGLQGVLQLVVSSPVWLAADATTPPDLGPLAVLGVLLWLVGMVFETGGDLQLARFKADPAHEGQVMDRGLWRYTRHPNYFGDFCVWWGVFLVAAETGPGRWGVVGPIVMTDFLLKVSGVAMLERDIGSRRPGYADYVARTSAFLPRPPKQA